MTTQQEALWAGDFGLNYTKRNMVDWRKRVPFWKDIMDRTGARSVLEIGCNAGWNLTAIKQVAPWVGITWGLDVNESALKKATAAGLTVHQGTSAEAVENWVTKEGMSAELVFTAGVLIHVPPTDLEQMMKDIIALSNHWILAIEYESEAEAEVIYRGEKDMLWKRPFGRLYQDMGLHLKYVGSAFKDQGFDDCTVWLLEKPSPTYTPAIAGA